MFAYVRAGLSILAIFLVIVAILHAKVGMSWETLLGPMVRRSQRSFLLASEVVAPTDFIWKQKRAGQQSLNWSETTRDGLRGLSWSETRRLSVGLRVQVRQRVAGDGPRNDQNNDGKGVKRAEVPPAENFPGCPGGCLSAAVCVWVLVLWLFVPSRCWVLGAGLGCPGPFPRGWLLPLSSWFRLLCWLS